MWTKLWFYSNSVLLLSFFFSYCFQTLRGSLLLFPQNHDQEIWNLFPDWKTLSWVLIYQWIQKARDVFHGCVVLCVCILNFTCHLLPCHLKSVINWYSQANWTAPFYQSRLSHSAFSLFFHLIPRCTIFVHFCHWCDLSAGQLNSLSRDKSWVFLLKVFWDSWLPVKDLSVQMNFVLSANWPHGIKLLHKISEDVEQQRFLWVLETALYCVI